MERVTVKNYQKFANRTLASLGKRAYDGAHMILGFTTELGELQEGIDNNNIVNIMEESGDTYWYIANACSIYGLSFEQTIKTAHEQGSFGSFKLHEIADLFKRELAYGKEMNIILLQTNLVQLVQYLQYISDYYSLNLENTLQKNIDKLYARYPDKFDGDLAINRDTEKEYKILKGE